MYRHSSGFGKRSCVALLTVLGLLVAAAVFGPDLLAYHRFSQAVEVMSGADERHGGPWPQLHHVCMPCHGNAGDSLNQLYPDLAGLPRVYFIQQMNAFASGARRHHAMSPLSAVLSQDEIEELASYFSSRPVVANISFRPDAAWRTEGESLAQQLGCAACHGEHFSGQDNFPGLAGQGLDYLVTQMQAYRAAARPDPSGAMPAIAANLSDKDITALAHYLSSYAANPENE